MPDTFFNHFTLELPEHGTLENLPATYAIGDTCTLCNVRVGDFNASREAVVTMTSEEGVARQERVAFDRWCEAACDFWAGADEALEAAE
jgi:hypothetical protein